jgi:murein DD-endopeptidase MepM/ murein hydrolase activator NlpD
VTKNKQRSFLFVFFVALFLIPFAVVNAFFSLYSAIVTESTSLRQNIENEILKKEKILNSQNVEILKPNLGIDLTLAQGGGEITILDNTAILAESGVSGTALDVEKVKNNGRISLYEVREGDSLSQIAEMFGVSMNTIKWANDLKADIKPGQQLVILPVSGVRHTVKNGGTINDLAKIYEADAEEIAIFNGLAINTELKAGDEIIIPNVDPKIQEDTKDAKSSGTTKKIAVNDVKVSYSGYYSHPVPGSIVTQGLHGYNAIDFGAPYGTPVRAAADGSVITSKEGGWNGGYGNFIVISHDNGTQTLYSHQSSNSVYVGQKVKAGQVVGYVGSTGRSTGNHLHFEIRGAKNPWSSCAVGRKCD